MIANSISTGLEKHRFILGRLFTYRKASYSLNDRQVVDKMYRKKKDINNLSTLSTFLLVKLLTNGCNLCGYI